jgi:PKD repeat protein
MKSTLTLLLTSLLLGTFSFAQSHQILPTKTEDYTAIRQVPGTRYVFEQLTPQQEYSILLTTPHSFSCLGLGWKINSTSVKVDDLSFTYRTLSPEGIWTEWLQADADFSPEDTPTAMFWTDLLFTIDATNHLAIEIKLTNPTAVQELILDLFDGNVDAHPNHGYLEDQHEDLNGGQRSCPAFPTIIPRANWCGGSAPCADVNAAYTVTNISPTHVVMHHGASPNTYTDGQAVVRSYWNYHVNTLGWADIGYNYLIDKYGNFYQGRRNLNLPNQDVRGAHAGNANGGSIGMNFLGNLDVTIATTVQLQKLYEFLAWWFNHKSYDPLSSAGMTTQSHGWQIEQRFVTHNKIGSTACPGTDMISRMQNIRLETKALIDACSMPTDTDPPSTVALTDYDWRSNDFWVTYDDVDPSGGTGVEKSFYQVIDFNGTEWRGNHSNGFFNDNFTTAIHPEWTTQAGTWSVTSGYIQQTDQTVVNTNIHAALTQNNQSEYLYHWKMHISGTGTNRRAGMHFFASSPTLSNLGDSYLVYFRTDTDKCQIYRCTGNSINLVTDDVITVPANQWLDCKVTYNPTTGVLKAYLNDQLASTYTDPSPIQTGSYFSLRNGECNVRYDDVKVRKSRTTQTLITVGPASSKDARYESPNPSQDACRINTIVKDGAENWSPAVAKSIYIDWTLPTTSSTVNGNWQTTDFDVNYTDADNTDGSGLARRFYQVIDFDGTDWRANNDRGFFSDNFDLALHPDWNVVTGTWNTTGGTLNQTDNSNGNTNVYASLNQNLSNRYLYNFDMKIEGTGTNRRAGFHYFCDQPTLTNRGNSYFVWFRVELQTLEFYKVSNDTFSQEKVIPCVTTPGQWYNVSVVYDRVTGETFVYRDHKLIGEWKDSAPYFNGDYISFRTGNSTMGVNNLKVYRTRTATTTVTVGSPTSDIRYQNPDPTTFSAKVKSITADHAHNLSAVYYHDLNIDWTPPSDVSFVNDGAAADIATQTSTSNLAANWDNSSDQHSGVTKYWYAIGTSSGATDVVNWTDNGVNTSYALSGLSLTVGTTYYTSIRSENGAGLLSSSISSDGVTIEDPNGNTTAGFNAVSTTVCQGEAIQLTNTSTNATSYTWSTSAGTLSSTTDENPTLIVPTSGNYTVSLTANGPNGSANSSQNLNITVHTPPQAVPGVVNSTVAMGANVLFTNASTQATGFFWNFGNGLTSTDQNPWTVYNQIGSYSVMLVAYGNGTCANDTSYLTIQVLDASSIAEIEGLSSISLYPNPSNGQFELSLQSIQPTTVSIALYDMVGKLITTLSQETTVIGQVTLAIDVTGLNLSSGMYNLVLQSADGRLNKPFLLSK